MLRTIGLTYVHNFTACRYNIIIYMLYMYIYYTLYLQPLSLVKLTSSTVPSSKCSKETIRRRSSEIEMIRDQLSMGDSSVQMGTEIRVLPKDERERIMKEANFTVTIPPEQGLAMKANLNIPWNKLRTMRR